MMNNSPALLSFSRQVLRILIVLNYVALLAFLTVLAISIIWQTKFLLVLAEQHGDARAIVLLEGLRWILVLGMLAVPLAWLILTRLLAMVETVRSGDPFLPENGRRLTGIAWGLLGLQILDLVFGAIAMSFEGDDVPISGWTFDITGWIAVLLLFVLARVFQHGARMREDMEGTV